MMDLTLQLKIIPMLEEGYLKFQKGFFAWRPPSLDRKDDAMSSPPLHTFITLDPNHYKSKTYHQITSLDN